MKRRFRVDVHKIDSYEIDVDEMYIDADFFEEYNKEFKRVDSLEEHVINVAIHRSLYGDDYIPGYGRPLVNGRETRRTPFGTAQIGFDIRIISENHPESVDVKEVGYNE